MNQKNIDEKLQKLRIKIFDTGEKFRDKEMKEMGYEYPQSWMLFDEDELSDLIDKYEELVEVISNEKSRKDRKDIRNNKEDMERPSRPEIGSNNRR